ncbi:MAG: hypothetical protein ACREJN_21380 [Nitrospiraceae bacterium]
MSAGWNVYNAALPQAGKSLTSGTANENAGTSSLDAAKSYWQNLTSGNRTAVAGAAAPVANAAQAQGDAALREQAQMGTARGGGVNAENQQIKQNEQKQVTDAVAGVQPKAAEELAGVGTAQANVGHQQMAEALQSLGLSEDVAKELIDSSIQSRPISEAANQAVIGQWSNLLGAIGL